MCGLYLAPTTEKDFEDYYMVRSDPGDVYWNGYSSPPEKESFRKGFIKRTSEASFEKPEDRRNYLIKETDTNATIGFAQLIRREDAIEIGVSIISAYQGKGYGTKAMSLAVSLAKEYGMPVITHIREDNIASQKMCLNNGYKKTNEFFEKDCYNAGEIKLFKYILEQD